MVAGETREIGKNSMELSRSGEAHADLFFKLSSKRRLDRLVPFHAAAREEPSRAVAVAHEEHPVLAIDHHPLRAEREPSPHPPARTQYEARDWKRRWFLHRLQTCLLAPTVRGYLRCTAAIGFVLHFDQLYATLDCIQELGRRYLYRPWAARHPLSGWHSRHRKRSQPSRTSRLWQRGRA